MTDTNIFKLARPGTFPSSLTEISRSGARALLTQAVEAEVADFLRRHIDLKTERCPSALHWEASGDCRTTPVERHGLRTQEFRAMPIVG